MNHYRDPLAGLRTQVEDHRRTVDELTRRLTPMQRLVLGPEVARTTEVLAAQATAARARTVETVDTISEALRALAALEATLADSVARAPGLLRCPTDAPELGEAPRPPWTLLRRAVDLQPIVHWLIAPYKPAIISAWGTEGAAARFRASGGHPLVLAARASLVEGILAPTVRAIEIALLTSIPSSLPGVLIRLHERWRVFERPRSTVRDSAFDATFVVSGAAEAAQLLLDAPARRALLALRALAPRVRIGSGVVEIGLTMPWPRSAATPLPAPAVTFVTALRKRIASASSPEAL